MKVNCGIEFNRLFALFSVFIVVVFDCFLGCSRRPGGDPNVILIVVDTLRADHLGCYGYMEDTSPNIDRFARKSVLFSQVYSPSSWTRSSIASILTSKLPIEHGILYESPKAVLESEFETIPELLANNGYKTALIYTNPHYEFGLKQGFDYTDYTKDGKAELVYKKAEGWLKKKGDKKFFLMIHNNDPHDGYAYHPGISRYPKDSPYRTLQPYFPIRRIGDDGSCNYKSNKTIRLKEKEINEMIGNYDDEIRYLDRYFGEFLEYLEKSGLMERTIVVFTSDHGEEFLDHGGYWHGLTLYNELIHVPLICYVPGMDQRVVDTRVSTLDLLPTLLDLCGLKGSYPSENISGRSLVPLMMGYESRDRVVFSGTEFRKTRKYSLIVENYKIIRDDKEKTIEVYDIERDPKERRNIEDPKVRRELKKRLNFLMKLKKRKGRLDDNGNKGKVMDEKLKRALRELGYL